MATSGKLPNGAAETYYYSTGKGLRRSLELPTLSVTLMGKNIEPVTTAKDLRVYIDNSFNCNDHINKLDL